jgi:hypothetical protein
MVHHFVVFEEVFAGEEVALFDFLLGAQNPFADALVFDGLAFFHTEPAQHADGPVTCEHLHQIILQADVET